MSIEPDETAEKRALIAKIHAQREQWAFDDQDDDAALAAVEFPRSKTMKWAIDHPTVALAGVVAAAVIARRPLAKVGVFAAGIAARRWISRLG
ncbi:hypothetical protein BH09PSE6_BH09PSE6_02500 [soil metagenome]